MWFASWLRPRMIMTATASAAGGGLRQGSTFVPQRPREEAAIEDYINTKMSGPLPIGTAFLVVTGSQGIGKSTMLRRAFSKLWKRGWWRGRWPMEANLELNQSLQLSTVLAAVLRQPDKDMPSQEIWLLTTLNELGKACTSVPWSFTCNLPQKNARMSSATTSVTPSLPHWVHSRGVSPTTMPFASSSLRSACPS